jgi:2-hydroxycyclohexanecarboxyl-CoA dehydrogenase
MQACFPDMKARGGRIVNLGSGAATVGLPEVGAYAIAKEGIRGLTKVAAASWGKYDITANTICPMVTSPLYNRCGRPGPKPSARGTWKRFHAADGRRRK